MKTEFAERMDSIGTETAFEVLAAARLLEAQGRSIIHLEIGEPDFDTPVYITEAAIRALHDGYTHYTPAAGLPEARFAVADYVSRTRGSTRKSCSPRGCEIAPEVRCVAMLKAESSGKRARQKNGEVA